MGRATHCSDTERSIIKNLKSKGQSQQKIARIIGRSQNFVFNALREKKNNFLRGRPRKTSTKEDNHIKLLSTRDPFKSAATIRAELGVEISARTVRRRLVEKNLFGRSSRKVPMLTKRHRQNRILFAKSGETCYGRTNRKSI